MNQPMEVLGVEFSSGWIALASAVLVVIVLWYAWKWWNGESFMPSQTMRMQQNDNLLIGSSEHQSAAAASGAVTPSASTTAPALAAGNAPATFFQQAVQSSTQGTLNYDPNAPAGAPGSLGYMVLNSPDFACSTRTPVTDNAWSWMTAVAYSSDPSSSSSSTSTASSASSESMKGGVKTDNQLSALLAGH
jgi:hypothetical protein